ncbi:hypothetical protein FB45DRAFT_1018870 [Roridomyces roridus]|uniref:F-box domain-containing protein n=1 Tax=Roridomyces roridus TaxID=1738132 RepID=A0AAD7CDR5_9AGAR|nr:hypothetical protein FB45DRAFT_1018870 [Roridomyces roridus]
MSFSEKLGTNYCPTDYEVLHIQGLLVEPLDKLSKIDDEIAELQKSLNKLTEQRVHLAAYIDAHKALISSVRRLPFDIVQEIFVACLPTHRNCVMSAKEAPILLGRICSAWRAIAYSTPRLWASLHVVEPARPLLRPLRPEAMKTWLVRSGSHPLSLSYNGTAELRPLPSDNDANVDSTPLFLRELIALAGRWKDFAFFAPTSQLEALCCLNESDVPMLKNIHLSHSPYQYFLSPIGNRLIFLRGGRVSSLSVPATILEHTQLSSLAWGQLTDLSMIGGESVGTPSPELTALAILAILSRCSALRSCRLAVKATDDDPRDETCPIELPLLHTLQVTSRDDAPSHFHSLLFSLSLPSLLKFHLGGWIGAEANVDLGTATHAGRFFSQMTQLEEFAMDCPTLNASSEFFIDALPMLPSTLRTLRIPHDPDITNWVLLALAPSEHSPILFPDLRSIYIPNGYHVSDDAIVNFLTTRAAGGAPLKQITVDFRRAMLRDVLPDLGLLMQAGLEVSFKYYTPDNYINSPWRGLPDDPGPARQPKY